MAHSAITLTPFVDGKHAQKKMRVSSKSSVEQLLDELVKAKVIEDYCVSVYNAQSQKLKLRDKVGKCLKDGQRVIVNTIGSPACLIKNAVHSTEPTFTIRSTSRRKTVKKQKSNNKIEHSKTVISEPKIVDHETENAGIEDDVGHPIRKVRSRRKKNTDGPRFEQKSAAGIDSQQKLAPVCDGLYDTNLHNDVGSSDDDVVIVKMTGEKDISKKKLISNIKVYLRRHQHLSKIDVNYVIAEMQRIFERDLSDRYNLIESIVHNLLDNPTTWLEEDQRMTAYAAVVGSYQLSSEDLHTLHGSNWLNDNVINAYNQLLMSRQRDVFIFPTYFYTKLKKHGYDSVKKWVKKTDLFTKTVVLFPIHGGNHWMLVVCEMADKTLTFLDSIQGRCNNNCLQLLICYIEKEALSHEYLEMIGGWTAKYMKGIPQQTNGYDCGVFVCQYSKLLLQKQPLDFSQNDIPEIRRQMHKELVNNHIL